MGGEVRQGYAAVLLGPDGPQRASLAAHLKAEGFDVHASAHALDANEIALVVLLDAATEAPSALLDACRAARADGLDGCFVVTATERDEEHHVRALIDA